MAIKTSYNTWNIGKDSITISFLEVTLLIIVCNKRREKR